MTEKWKTFTEIYKGKVFTLGSGQISLEDGTEAIRDVVVHPGGVVTLPILDEKIMFIRQYRIALGKEILELPGGRVEKIEDREERARTELLEETGYRAKKIELLGCYYPVPGFTNLKISIYEGNDLEYVGTKLEWDEKIDIVMISIENAELMLREGKFEDGSVIIALSYFFSR